MAKTALCGAIVFAALLAGCSPSVNETAKRGSKTDDQIAFYEDKIASSPKHYPSYAILAGSLLQKTRETGDPRFLAEARQNALTSMDIQPNYQAMKTMASVCNYSHRFADALLWGEKAAQASPEGLAFDSEVSAILIEADLGLGNIETAARILDDLSTIGKKPDNFFIATARASILKAQNKPDEAARAFNEAALFAAKEKADELVVWCYAMAAGCFLDAGRPAESEPYLELAANIAPENKLVNIHRAELLLATNHAREALDTYQKILQSSDDAEIHRRAYVIARQLGQNDLADKHFEAAASGFRKVLDSGEIYTLGPLAQLYCDAGVNGKEAKKLARENFEYKKDAEAQKTSKCVTDKFGS